MQNSRNRRFARAVLAFGGVLSLAACQRAETKADEPAASPPAETPAAKPPAETLAKAAVTTTPPAAMPSASPASPAPPIVEVAAYSTCQSNADMGTVLSRIVDVADTDGNGEISKDEAYSTVDFMLGGFFFRADGNGDGTISPEEGRAARKELMTRYPTIGFMLRDINGEKAQASMGTLAELLDIEYGKSVSASEMRRAAHTVVDQVFLRADSDKNGSLTTAEARSASWQGVKALGRAAFQATDGNQDNKLSLEEFRSALDAPTKMAFDVSDADHDGSLTESEAAVAMSRVVNRLWMPAEKPAVIAVVAKTP